jgi:crotonobetainyl-CoA:carnitine CoA-transferase CaiB-like acyl-CoA transferase
MAQALGGIAQAYATPGQPMKTGIASVADETTAILAFGGALAALTHARTTGQGQKVELSLLGSIVRLLGWTFQTTMWRGTDPVTGQARVAGTREAPAMSASFNDRDGKPFVFQLARDQWKESMVACGFYDAVSEAGFGHLGVAMDSSEKREELLALLGRLFATGTRDEWVSKLRAGDIVSAPINTMLEAAVDPDVVANGYVMEMDYPEHGRRMKIHGSPWQFSETPANLGRAPKLGEHNGDVLGRLGYSVADIAALKEKGVI